MDAIPYAIYSAPLELFRSDVTKRLSGDEQLYYIQLLHRVNAQSYAVLVASSCDDLVALHRGEATESIERRVLVTTISRQDLHQRCSLVLAPEAETPLYAAPAAILHDDDLRAVASAAWLTYCRVLHRHACGSVTVRLGAHVGRVDDHRRSSTTTLTAEEFAQALPVGRRELALATCDLLELVEAHAESVTGRPVEHIAPVVCLDEEADAHETPTPARSYPPEVMQMLRIQDQPCRRARLEQNEQQQERRDASPAPSARIDLEQAIIVEDADLPSHLAPVIDAQILEAAWSDYAARPDAYALLGTLQRHMRKQTSSFHVQQLLLQAALDTVMRQLYGCQETERVQQLTARCLQIAQLKRWHRANRQRVVEAVPLYDLHERCTTWRLVDMAAEA